MSEQLLNPFLTKLLHLSDPFFIKETTFSEQSGEVHHIIDINRGTKFDCPIYGKEGVNIHDRLHNAWRHMNIYEYRIYIHFATPRVNCPICGVHLIEVPWSRPNSKFTELNEYLILALSTHMHIVSVAHLIKEYDTKIWRTVQHYVDSQHSNTEWSSLTNLGIDETSSKKGHSYISTFVDVENATVVYATPGKDASTITSFVEEMPKHKADSVQIKEDIWICLQLLSAVLRLIFLKPPSLLTNFT
jgi:transposase